MRQSKALEKTSLQSFSSTVQLGNSQSIDEFIFQSIESGYTCILIGEQHGGGQSGAEALSEIAGKLERYVKTKQIRMVIFNENLPASDGFFSRPISAEQFKKCQTVSNWKTSKILHDHNIPVYGLENNVTDPIPFIEQASIQEANQFLIKLGLFESFVRKYNNKFLEGKLIEGFFQTAGEILKKIEDPMYKTLVLDAYTNSDYRIVFPNKEFSKYISQMPNDTICIVIVGSKHIPRVVRGEAILDQGMQERLQEKRETISTFVAAPSVNTTTPYRPKKEGDLEYSSIEHVSYALAPHTLIQDAIDHKINKLDQQLFSQTRHGNTISALKILKKVISGEIKYGDNPAFSNVLESWWEDTEHFRGNSDKKNVSIRTVLSGKQDILFFIENLRKKYGNKTMNKLRVTPTIHHLQKTKEIPEKIIFVNTLANQINGKLNTNFNLAPILTTALENYDYLLSNLQNQLEPLAERIAQEIKSRKKEEEEEEEEEEDTEINQLAPVIQIAIRNFIRQNFTESTSAMFNTSRLLGQHVAYQTNSLQGQGSSQLTTRATNSGLSLFNSHQQLYEGRRIVDNDFFNNFGDDFDDDDLDGDSSINPS